MDFTAFWEHPYHGSGRLTLDWPVNAKEASNAAFEEVADYFLVDAADECDLCMIMDDMNIEVWSGALFDKPNTPPDHVYS